MATLLSGSRTDVGRLRSALLISSPWALRTQDAPEPRVHLGELSTGERAVITGVAQSEAHCQLCGMGVIPGAEIEIVRHLSRGAMILLRVDGADVALRDVTATTVKIRRQD